MKVITLRTAILVLFILFFNEVLTGGEAQRMASHNKGLRGHNDSKDSEDLSETH